MPPSSPTPPTTKQFTLTEAQPPYAAGAVASSSLSREVDIRIAPHASPALLYDKRSGYFNTPSRERADWHNFVTRSAASSRDPLRDCDFRIGLTFLGDGEWLAIDSLVGGYGLGGTCAAAVEDLVGTLFEDRDLLRGHRDALAPRLRRDLAVLDADLRDEMR